MKITVFTSNQPRHLSLIEDLALLADKVYVIQECSTVFPGQVQDFFKRSTVMQEYFSHVMTAEKEIFGSPRFLPDNVSSISMRLGDLNKLDMDVLQPALNSDYYMVFGSSYIKGDLIDFLVQNKALNIHMGISPYYRGSSCNFWALYDKNPDYVGATIHLLSKGLDSGPMLFHAVPKAEKCNAFSLGMHAVKAAHNGLVSNIRSGEIFKFSPVPQSKENEIKYTRNQDFSDEVASRYLANLPSEEAILSSLQARKDHLLLHPHIG